MTSYDALLAQQATGVLAAFNAAGVLTAADVHVAQRLGRLGGEDDERVLLAAALAVRGARHGSVVLDLAHAAETISADEEGDQVSAPEVVLDWPDQEGWLAGCAGSPLVHVGEGTSWGKPLRLVDGLLWLDRYWRQERQVGDEVLGRAGAEPLAQDTASVRATLSRLFPSAQPDGQRLAVAVCSMSRISILAGGPGTGKTTTVAKLLATLLAGPEPLRVALAAPTGKAAVRLQEAVQAAASRLPEPDRLRLQDLTASTLHRLLGNRPGSRSRFRHDAGNRLPYDVVVVDEASMVSLTLMSRLLEALRPDTRLLLVGDPHQLASVEAGAVLGDLVGPPGPVLRTAEMAARLSDLAPLDVPAGMPVAADSPVARLRGAVVQLGTNYRFPEDSPIGRLAGAVRAGDASAALAVLSDGSPQVRLVEVPDEQRLSGVVLELLREKLLTAAGEVIAAARDGDAGAALRALDSHRLLCAHRRGPRGVRWWTDQVTRWVAQAHQLTPGPDGRYVGQPLLVTANDYDVGLFNGDTGVVLERDAELVAVFSRGAEPLWVPLARMADVRPMHALTVHRSQGSECARVTVLLPPASSPLGTRETLYTALTRATEQVLVIGSAEALVRSVERQAARATGLGRRLL